MASARFSCTMFVKMSMSVTTNMPAKMIVQSQPSMNHDMSLMNHDMSNMEASQGSGMADCCSDNNHCNMSSCLVLALTNIIPLSITSISSNRVYFETTLIPSQTSTSLYRPPILA